MKRLLLLAALAPFAVGAQTPTSQLLPTLPSAATPADSAQRDIRVQVVAETSTTIGAPMAGRLKEFPLRDGDRFSRGDVLARFVCGERDGAVARARGLLAAKQRFFESRATLRNLGTGSGVEYGVAAAEVAEAAGELASAQAMVESCVVSAPFTGRVANVEAHNWQFVQLGQPLLDILDDHDLVLEMVVPSRWLSWLVAETPFEVAIDETGATYAAKVARLSGKVDPISRSIKVYGRLTGPQGALLPGMSGRALINPPAEAHVPPK